MPTTTVNRIAFFYVIQCRNKSVDYSYSKGIGFILHDNCVKRKAQNGKEILAFIAENKLCNCETKQYKANQMSNMHCIVWKGCLRICSYMHILYWLHGIEFKATLSCYSRQTLKAKFIEYRSIIELFHFNASAHHS